MRAITVEARSLDSARRLYDALAGFHPELLGSEQEGFRVSVELRAGDRDVVSVLGAIEQYVNGGPDDRAQLELGGRHYTIHGTHV